MKAAWIIIGLAAAYLIAQLMLVWRTRNQIPPPPPGGWRRGSFEDENEDENENEDRNEHGAGNGGGRLPPA